MRHVVDEYLAGGPFIIMQVLDKYDIIMINQITELLFHFPCLVRAANQRAKSMTVKRLIRYIIS